MAYASEREHKNWSNESSDQEEEIERYEADENAHQDYHSEEEEEINEQTKALRPNSLKYTKIANALEKMADSSQPRRQAILERFATEQILHQNEQEELEDKEHWPTTCAEASEHCGCQQRRKRRRNHPEHNICLLCQQISDESGSEDEYEGTGRFYGANLHQQLRESSDRKPRKRGVLSKNHTTISIPRGTGKRRKQQKKNTGGKKCYFCDD